jgi:type III secretory pathway component EscR
MLLYNILLPIDIIALILAAILFAVGKMKGEAMTRRLATPIKVLLGVALVSFLVNEFLIGRFGNQLWGLGLIVVGAVAIFFFVRKTSGKN